MTKYIVMIINTFTQPERLNYNSIFKAVFFKDHNLDIIKYSMLYDLRPKPKQNNQLFFFPEITNQ